MAKKTTKRVKSKLAKKTTKKKVPKKSKTGASRINRSGSKKSKQTLKSKVGVRRKPQQASVHTARQDWAIVVRIMGEGQYRLDPTAAEKLNEIDNEIVKIVQAAPHEAGSDGLYKRFQKMLGEM